jgi:hypothetical protein
MATLLLRNSLLDSINFGVDGVVDSLLSDHGSESVEVGHVLLGLSSSNLLSPCGLLEGLDSTGLLQSLSDDSRRGSTADLDLVISQRQPADGDLLLLNA